MEEIKLATVVQDIPSVEEMYKLIVTESQKLSESDVYFSSKNELDLIFYITRTRATLVIKEEINSNDFSNLGWRSISCLNTKQAIVLYASKSAPDFIKNKTKYMFNSTLV